MSDRPTPELALARALRNHSKVGMTVSSVRAVLDGLQADDGYVVVHPEDHRRKSVLSGRRTEYAHGWNDALDDVFGVFESVGPSDAEVYADLGQPKTGDEMREFGGGS